MSFDCNRTFFQYLVLFHPRNSRSWPRTSASCKPWEGQHCKSMGIKGGRVLRCRAKVGRFFLTDISRSMYLCGQERGLLGKHQHWDEALVGPLSPFEALKALDIFPGTYCPGHYQIVLEQTGRYDIACQIYIVSPSKSLLTKCHRCRSAIWPPSSAEKRSSPSCWQIFLWGTFSWCIYPLQWTDVPWMWKQALQAKS